MAFTAEQTITVLAAAVTLLLFIFAVDWRRFRDVIVIFLFEALLDLVWGSAVVSRGLLEYPDRLLPKYYDTSILFELWVFPVLCVLYNQAARHRRLPAALGYALLFSAGITAIEYPLERYTDLIEYRHWTWLISFCTIAASFLASRLFLAFFIWGCDRSGGLGPRGGRQS